MRRTLPFVILAAFSQVAIADTFRDYKMIVDKPDPNATYHSFGAANSDFTKGRWWGSSGQDQGNFLNQSQNRTIYGMLLKLKYPKTNVGEGDTFASDSTGGAAFPDIWRKKDGSQLILRSTVGISPRKYFYLQIPKTDDTDDRDRFFTQLYSEMGKPDIPDDGTWEKMKQPLSAKNQLLSPPSEIRQKVFLFEQAVEDSKDSQAEVKKSVSRGADYYGKPYFLGGSDFGKAGFFTFWLFNPTAKSYRSFSIDVTQSAGQALMKTVLFAFEQKAQWVAVYSEESSDKPIYVIVYP